MAPVTCHLPPALVGYFFSWTSQECTRLLSDRSLNGIYGVTLTSYLLLFALTCLLEGPFYFRTMGTQPLKRKLCGVLTLNLCTHPLVVLGFPQFFALNGYPRWASLLSSEIFAGSVEAAILSVLFSLPMRVSAAWAIATNLFSWWVGGLLVTLF